MVSPLLPVSLWLVLNGGCLWLQHIESSFFFVVLWRSLVTQEISEGLFNGARKHSMYVIVKTTTFKSDYCLYCLSYGKKALSPLGACRFDWSRCCQFSLNGMVQYCEVKCSTQPLVHMAPGQIIYCIFQTLEVFWLFSGHGKRSFLGARGFLR